MSAIFRVFLAGLFGLVVTSAASADLLDTIKQRGKLIVAAKTDYPPWGFQEADGTFKGMEIELARDLGRRLGVEVEFVPAYSSNRVQLLNEGKADVILATFSVTEERKKQVYFIEPSYYAAMIGIITRTDSGIGGEATLKGRKICAVSGNYSNPTVEKFVGQPLIEFKTLTEAQEKLRAGECDGVNFDDVVLLYQLKSEEDKWKDYDIALLLTVDPAPWGLAVKLDERDGRFAAFLSDTVKDWHRRNTLLALERKWVGENSMALQWLSDRVKAAIAAEAAAKAQAEPKETAAPSAPAAEAPAQASTEAEAPAQTSSEADAPANAAAAPAPAPAPEPAPASGTVAAPAPAKVGTAAASAPEAEPKADTAPKTAAPKAAAAPAASTGETSPAPAAKKPAPKRSAEKVPSTPVRKPVQKEEKKEEFNYFGR